MWSDARFISKKKKYNPVKYYRWWFQKLFSESTNFKRDDQSSFEKRIIIIKKKYGVALTQLSLTLHYSRRIFYYQHYIHNYSFFPMHWSWWFTCFYIYCLKYLSLKFHILLESGSIHLITSNKCFILYPK